MTGHVHAELPIIIFYILDANMARNRYDLRMPQVRIPLEFRVVDTKNMNVCAQFGVRRSGG
jgi:hypothetical protein